MTCVNSPVNTINAINSAVETLIAKRQAWEKGTYAASLKELYELLGGCLDLYNAIKARPVLGQAVKELLIANGFIVTDNTSLQLRIARLVFETTASNSTIKNRIHAYARVIRIAADNGQTSATLAQFVASHGGIEEIRRSGLGSNKLKPSEEKRVNREFATKHFVAPRLNGLFAPFQLPEALEPEAGQSFSVALVRKNDDGTGTIVFGTGNVPAVLAVLAEAGKHLRTEVHKQAESQLLAEQRAQQQQNINEVAAMLDAALSPALAAA